MRISIIIPVHNRAELVGDAIASALREPAGETEVIVVDDGSTDHTPEILKGFEGRIRIISQPNRGVSAARNAGLAIAEGKYVKFLDSDDTLVEGGIAALSRYLDEAFSNSLIPFGDASGTISGVPDDSYGFPNSDPGIMTRVTLLGGTMPPWLPLFRTSWLRKIGGFSEQLSFGEDQDLAIRLTAIGAIFVRVPIPVVAVNRDHEGRLSGTKDCSKYLALTQAIEATLRGHTMHPFEAKSFAKWIWVLARKAARYGDTAIASSLFAQATALAGRQAENASGPTRALYRVMSPVAVERRLEKLKSLRR